MFINQFQATHFYSIARFSCKADSKIIQVVACVIIEVVCIMFGRKQLLFGLLLATWAILILAVYSRNPNSLVSNISLFFRNQHQQGKEYFKVVSAISSNHFEEAKDMIASAQRFLPTTRIVVYDLGLKENERNELKSFCNVEVRNFVFKQYPPHFRNLYKYAWKPTMIKTVAQEAEYVCWADASVRFVESFESALTTLDKFPVKGHKHPFKIVQVTHEISLQYLKMTRKKMQDVIGVEATLLLFKTNTLVMNLLDQWCECAAHELCIAPPNSSIWGCNFKNVTSQSLEYIGCHRFDQSVLNVIIVRDYGKEVFRDIFDSILNEMKMVKHPSKMYIKSLKKCWQHQYSDFWLSFW